MVELKNISYSYPSPIGKTLALTDISVSIPNGITAVIGHTGSGKTTLTEIIAGILTPDTGSVTVDGIPIKSYKKIGIVFQSPDTQLFADTVYDDIAFGPRNQGIKGDELDLRVREAARTVGLEDEYLKMDPYTISGGKKRLAALAGVLAMQPELLILDEPAAGLDPSGRRNMFSILKRLSADEKMTIIFVTHSIEDAAEHAENILILKNGKMTAFGSPDQILTNTMLLDKCGIELPDLMRLSTELQKLGLGSANFITLSDACRSITALIKGGNIDAS